MILLDEEKSLHTDDKIASKGNMNYMTTSFVSLLKDKNEFK